MMMRMPGCGRCGRGLSEIQSVVFESWAANVDCILAVVPRRALMLLLLGGYPRIGCVEVHLGGDA